MLLAMAVTSAGAQEPADRQLIAVAGNDSAMNAAIAEAQATIASFIQRLDHPPATQTDIGLKVRLTDGQAIEHVWLTDIKHDGDHFSGRINNDVERIHNYHVGDSVVVALSEVSDWLAIDRGQFIGGFSIRLLRARMSPAERAAFDRSVPFRVE
jgi:uncharacterized protein YegJ (DUF2314 family)